MKSLPVAWFLVVSLVVLAACGPMPTPEGPPQTPPGPVLLARFGPDLVVPVGCWSAADRRLVSGRQCLERVPTGDIIAASDLGALKVAERVQARCEITGAATPALRVVAPDGGALTWADARAFAVWPESARDGITPFDANPQELASLSSGVADALRAVLSDANGAVLVDQLVSFDIDRDGVADRIVSLSVEPDGDAPFRSTLFVGYGDGPLAQVLSGVDERLTVAAVADLNGSDGQRLIWVRRVRNTGEMASLQQWQGNEVTVVAEWGCW